MISRRWHKKDRLMYFIFSIPGLLLFCLFILTPLVLGFYYSMTDWDGISVKFNFVGIRNFIELASDMRVANSLFITFKYTFFITVVITILAIFLAIILNSSIKHTTFFRSIFFFPAVLSMITVGLIFSQIYFKPLPMIGKALGIGILSSNLLASKSTALFAIILIHIWHGTAVPTVMYIAGLQSIPGELLESAMIDGANPIQRFRAIVFPFIAPVMKVSLVLLVKSGITQFDYIKATTEGGPGAATETVSALIMDQAFGYSMKYGYAITESILLFAILVLVSLFQFNILGKKEVGQQ